MNHARKQRSWWIGTILVLIVLTGSHPAAEELRVDRMAKGLRVPWGISFIEGCSFLVTERRGRLVHFDDTGKRTEVDSGIRVLAKGQGGMLDVAVARDFRESRDVFLTYSRPGGAGGASTALATGRLSGDNRRLENVRDLLVAEPQQGGGRHFGSRVIEAPDGRLFMTIGDRGHRDSAQDLSTHNGTVVRINRDGSVPRDNPFVSDGSARPEIWSYGHRNAQGVALDGDGSLWTVEHGARGGDEINRIRPGANFGWPVISYGTNYSGSRIGIGTENEGMEQPEHYWDPSIAPADMMVYSGRLWPEWRGHFLVASLKFDYISRLDPEGGFREVQKIKLPETRRVRDVAEAPDGSIWFLSEDRQSVYRIVPGTIDTADLDCEIRSL